MALSLSVKSSLPTRKKTAYAKPLSGKLLLGIDIGTKSVKFVSGKLKNGRIELDCLTYANDNNNSTINGKITNIQAMKNLFGTGLANNRIATKMALCSVETQGLIKRELIIPHVEDKDILNTVTYEIAQYLSIDVSSYVIQFKKMGLIVEGGVEKLKIMVAAMPRGIVESYMQTLQLAGLEPQIMDCHSNSLEKLYRLCRQSGETSKFTEKDFVMIDMGHTSFNLTFFENGKYLFNRLLDIGGESIDLMISHLMNVDVHEAEQVKIINSQGNTIFDMAKTALEYPAKEKKNLGDKILTETFSIINGWFSEIEGVLRYYTNRNRDNALQAVYLFGGGANIQGIDVFFEKRLGIKTQVVKHLDIVDTGLNNQNISQYLNAIGLLSI